MGMEKNTDTTDKTVIIWERFMAGDKEAFSLLYQLFFDMLYRYGRKFVADEDAVKDCIQDLFVKLYNNRERLSLTTPPKFYLLLSLKNLLIDYLSKYNRLVYISPEELPFLVTYNFQEIHSADSESSGGIDDKTLDQFNKVLDLLNPRQKEALYLKFQLELSYDEVSKLLGINNQSARNLIYRAISKVRENMELSVFFALFYQAL